MSCYCLACRTLASRRPPHSGCPHICTAVSTACSTPRGGTATHWKLCTICVDKHNALSSLSRCVWFDCAKYCTVCNLDDWVLQIGFIQITWCYLKLIRLYYLFTWKHRIQKVLDLFWTNEGWTSEPTASLVMYWILWIWEKLLAMLQHFHFHSCDDFPKYT